MIVAFVLIAGTLATAAAAAAADTAAASARGPRPAAAMAAIAVLLAVLLGGAGLYAAFSNYKWNDTSTVADSPAA